MANRLFVRGTVIIAGIAIAVLLDVWLLGTLAAKTLDILRSPWSHTRPPALAPYYWHHPLSVAWSWVTKAHLSNPGVRTTWLILNLIVIAGFLYLLWSHIRWSFSNRKRKGDDKTIRDMGQLKIKTLQFDPWRFIETTPKDQIFLALSDKRKPITIPLNRLVEHVYILGPSGTGKTALEVIPICIQAIRRGLATIAIDFKGDKQAVQLLAEEAKKAGKRFYFFTLHPHIESNTYNPMVSGDAISKVERIMTPLQLVYEGEAKFYTYYQQSLFLPLLEHLDRQGVSYTIQDIAYYLNNPGLLGDIVEGEVDEKQLKGLTAALKPLVGIEKINSATPDIDLKRIMVDGDVCYFDLRAAIAPELSSAIGKMIAMDLQAIAGLHRNESDPIAVISIDEFQNMACKAFSNIISKVRSSRYAFVLSNQAFGDIRAAGGDDLLNALNINTFTKITFILEDPDDVDWFSRKSGTKLVSNYRQDMSSGNYSNQGKIAQPTQSQGMSSGISVDQAESGYLHGNILLSLPFGKSAIFRRGQRAILGNHSFFISERKKDVLINSPWPEPALAPSADGLNVAGLTASDLVAAAKADLAGTSSRAPAAPDPDQGEGPDEEIAL